MYIVKIKSESKEQATVKVTPNLQDALKKQSQLLKQGHTSFIVKRRRAR